MRRLRVYADASVFGGCFDEEFADQSTAFLREVSDGRFLLVIADVTIRELALAPEPVRKVLAGLRPEDVEFIPYSEEMGRLRDAYIAAGVLAGFQAVNLMQGYKPIRIHSPREVVEK